MKKISKKLGAIVLALCMCFSLCATALAASSDDTFSITIENSSYGMSYAVYKIFDVTYDDNGNYSYTVNSGESNWYTLFNDNPLFTVDEDTYYMPFVFTATTGETSGTYNVTVKTDDEGKALYTDDQIIGYLKAAINTIASYDEATKTWMVEDGYGFVTSATGNGDALTIDLDEAGYYFVTSEVGAIVSVTTTDPNPTITDKNSTIDIEKNIVHSDGTEDEWEADGMGEEVSFDVKAIVPIVEGEDYVLDYTITDSMTNGLLIELTEGQFYEENGKYYLIDDMINDWITLYDGSGTEVVNFTDYVYSYSFELIGHDAVTDETNTDSTVHTFSGFILTYYTYDVDQYKTDLAAALVADGYVLDSVWPSYPEGWPDASLIGDDFDFPSESYFENSKYPTNASLEIKYDAHVSSLESYENTNTITLDHEVTPFNHPVPWQPTPGPQKWSRDYVYSWELQILKIDGDGSETPLEGATFTLHSDNMMDVKVEYSWLYVQLSLLTGDTYTYEGVTYSVADFESTYYVSDGQGGYEHKSVDDIFNEDGTYKEGYSADTVFRRIVTSSETVDTEVESTHTATGTTDANGNLYFEGLGVGDYTLTEIVAPDGYNLLTEPIEFTIEWTEEDGFTVTYKDTESGYPSTMADGYILALSIENNSGTELPGTGGIGTTIFYIIGGVLVVGAVVVLVTRRRVNREA